MNDTKIRITKKRYRAGHNWQWIWAEFSKHDFCLSNLHEIYTINKTEAPLRMKKGTIFDCFLESGITLIYIDTFNATFNATDKTYICNNLHLLQQKEIAKQIGLYSSGIYTLRVIVDLEKVERGEGESC